MSPASRNGRRSSFPLPQRSAGNDEASMAPDGTDGPR
jgi:hypothetical protein